MTIEKIAQRFAFDRPGYKLVDYMEVGLPVYKLSLVCSFLEQKPLPALHEFTLRAINVGLTDEENVSGVLGLESRQVKQVLAELDAGDLVTVEPLQKGLPLLSLTSKGKACVSQALTVVPTLNTVVFHFDGLTRKLVPPQAEALWQYRQISAAGIREMATKPPRKPSLMEISIQDARHLSNHLSELRGKSKRQLLAIKTLENTSRFFQIAEVLFYRSLDDSDSDFSVIVDGLVSNPHKEAILKAGGLSRFGLGDLTKLSPPDLEILQRLPPAQKSELIARTDEVTKVLEEAHAGGLAAASGRDGDSAFPPKASPDAVIQEAIAAALKTIKTVHIRHLEVFEHPAFLDDALETSEKRLLIISPWIKRQVLDAARFRALRARLEDGCKVYLGWGIGKGDRSKDNHIDVVERLRDISKEFSNFYFCDLENTHEKILIKDSEYVITSSFNWLSFRGDPKRTVRFERGVFIGIKDFVDDEFAKLVVRFEAGKENTVPSAKLEELKGKFR